MLRADELLRSERARRNGLKPRQRQAGPGRPRGVATCPGCAGVFNLPEFRDHRFPCLREKLQLLKEARQEIRLKPIDVTPYNAFRVEEIKDDKIVFHKFSNQQLLEVPLRAIRGLTPPLNQEPAEIALRGGVRWKADIERWAFVPETA